MAMASAAGVVGGAVITALSPTKRGRSSSEEAAPQPEPERIVHNADHDDEEECAGEQVKDGRGRKGLKRGTADERWLARCFKEVVRRDLDAGCIIILGFCCGTCRTWDPRQVDRWATMAKTQSCWRF